jgi:hypothetical protein
LASTPIPAHLDTMDLNVERLCLDAELSGPVLNPSPNVSEAATLPVSLGSLSSLLPSWAVKGKGKVRE